VALTAIEFITQLGYFLNCPFDTLCLGAYAFSVLSAQKVNLLNIGMVCFLISSKLYSKFPSK
jgi:hypothetical protein